MNEVNIYNVVIESKFLKMTWYRSFASESLDDCINKINMYIEKLKTKQFASDYQIVGLRCTGTIIV